MKFLSKIISKRLEKFSRLEKELVMCRGISLAEEKRERMKGRILDFVAQKKSNVEEAGFAALIVKIRDVAAQLQVSLSFKALLREKLIAVADFHKKSFLHLPNLFMGNKKAWASLLVAVFVFTTVFNFAFNIRRVEASVNTVLEEVVGDVMVQRNGLWMPGESGLLLRVDDVIKTGKDSNVVVKFLDQSVSRLDENTEIKISKLFVNPLNSTETMVEVVLNKGRLWSRVISLIDNISLFQVKARNTVAVARKRAAFDVSLSSAKGNAKVVAVQNKVDLVVATDKKIIETTLVKGFTAEMETNNPTVAPQISPVSPDKTPAQQDKWVEDNLAKDKKYIEIVKQEAQDKVKNQVQVLPGSPLYMMKEISEGTKIALTMDEFERQKKVLYALQEKMAEAQVLFAKGEVDKAKGVLQNFQTQIKELYDWATHYENTDSTRALEIKTKIAETLDTYKKQLSLVLPTDPMYTFKESLRQTQLSVFGDDAEKKTQELLSQAGDKLLEAHDLAEQGNTVAASQQVQQYTQTVSEVMSGVKGLSSHDKEKAVTTLLDNKVEDLKSLETISAPPKQQEMSQDFQQQVGTTTATALIQAFINGTSVISTPPPQVGINSPSQSLFSPQKQIGTSSDIFITANSGTSTTPGVEEAAANKELQDVVTEAKTEALAKIGEAVLEIQKDQPSSDVLKKLENLEKVEVNGKSVLDVTLSKNGVLLKSDETVISVKGARPSAIDSKTPILPPKQP